jgi:tRNA A-37 threonylcarbamoyl transferase component Bud32
VTSQPQQKEGSVLDGKYEVLRHLGGGGMGEVYLVRHVHLDEKRVVKILRADREADPDAQKRFLREAKFATQIKHPHVAILYDYSRLADGSFYMVWEYIEGEDLGSRIRRDGPFPVRTALALAMQGLEGLNAIHGAGMIHRDVSPDNLMITTSAKGAPHLKIIDLGLAKNLEADPDLEVTQDGMFMGKLLYCAPEQAGLHKGVSLDNRSDLYSFGLVLYEMLTGLPPFEAETPQGAIFKRLSEDPLPLVGRNPGAPVPPEIERVVLRALKREREERFEDAVGFIEALRSVGKRLDRAATQEVPRPPAAAPGAARVQRPSQELTRAEKEDLLARIEQAARRVREGKARATAAEKVRKSEAEGAAEAEDRRTAEADATLDRLGAAVDAGRLDEAREALEAARALVPEAERSSARGARLEDLAGKVSALIRAAERRARIDEAEAMVQRYIQKKHLTLARLALDTLIELAPTHPKRSDFESWVGVLAGELEDDRRADEVLATAREALEREDLRTARRQLAQLQKSGDDRSADLAREIEETEQAARRSADVEEHRDRMEELLRERRVEEAQQELKLLGDLGVAKVTLDLYRSRLEETHSTARDEAQAEVFLEAFRERVEASDHPGAREVAGEFQRAMPDDPRPSKLVAELADREHAQDRRRSIEQGEAQVERFIEAGEAASAELALRVLLQMAPDHKRRRQLEKRIAKLKKG